MLPTKKYIVITVLILVLVTVVYIFVHYFPSRNSQTSLLDLIATKKSLYCEFDLDEGVAYVSNGRARVIIDTPLNGKKCKIKFVGG
jgi:hypothetical protein